MITEPLLTKAQSNRLWQAGVFGNKLRSWETIREWRLSNYRGPVALRCREGRGAGPCIYDVVPGEVCQAIEELQARGAREGDIMVNEMSPNIEILQGEYLNDVREINGEVIWGYFLHSRLRMRMRHALQLAPAVSCGLKSDLLLRQAMTTASYEDWQELLERYPGHVLEVSVYDRCLGDCPGRNALVWEVRQY